MFVKAVSYMLLKKYSLIIMLLLISTFDVESKEKMVINIKGFGGVPDDRKDDSFSFRKALEYISSIKKPVKLQLSAGRYLLSSTKNGYDTASLILKGQKNITIKGVGPETQLVMLDNQASGVLIQNCTNVEIADLSIDYQPIPFTQGTVVEVNESAKSFIVDIDKGFASPLSKNIITLENRKTRAYLFRQSDQRIAFKYHDQYPVLTNNKTEKKLEKLSNGNYLFRSQNKVEREFVGYKVVIIGRSKFDAVRIKNSEDIVVSGVDVYSSPSTAFKVLSSTGKITIKNSSVIPKPFTNRLLSTNADGVHAKFNRGPINVENSTFRSLGDDGINIGSVYLSVIQQLNSNTLLIEAHKSMRRGDKVTITEPESGKVISFGVIDTVDRVKNLIFGDILKVKFTSAIHTTLTLAENKHESKVNKITSLNSIGSYSVIKSNRFSNIRGRGIMLHSDHSIVKANKFYQFRGPGIVLGPDFSWGESSSGNNSSIINNVFYDIYRNNIFFQGAHSESLTTTTRNILIKNNVFTNYGREHPIPGRGEVGPAIYLDSVEDIRIHENIFRQPHSPSYSGPLIIITKARKIELLKNQVYAENQHWLAIRKYVDTNSLINK